eukprot:s975_g44.t1
MDRTPLDSSFPFDFPQPLVAPEELSVWEPLVVSVLPFWVSQTPLPTKPGFVSVTSVLPATLGTTSVEPDPPEEPLRWEPFMVSVLPFVVSPNLPLPFASAKPWLIGRTRSIPRRTFGVRTLHGVGLAFCGVPKLTLALRIDRALVILSDSGLAIELAKTLGNNIGRTRGIPRKTFGMRTLGGVGLALRGVPKLTIALRIHKALVILGDIGVELARTLGNNIGRTRSVPGRTFAVGTLHGVGLALRGVPKLALALRIRKALVKGTTSVQPEISFPEEPFGWEPFMVSVLVLPFMVSPNLPMPLESTKPWLVSVTSSLPLNLPEPLETPSVATEEPLSLWEPLESTKAWLVSATSSLPLNLPEPLETPSVATEISPEDPLGWEPLVVVLPFVVSPNLPLPFASTEPWLVSVVLPLNLPKPLETPSVEPESPEEPLG